MLLGVALIAGMGMEPNSCELLGLPALVDLVFKKVGHCRVVKGDADGRDGLLDGLEVFDQQQVFGRGDPKAADLGVAAMAEALELGPGRGREPQDRWVRQMELRPLAGCGRLYAGEFAHGSGGGGACWGCGGGGGDWLGAGGGASLVLAVGLGDGLGGVAGLASVAGFVCRLKRLV